MLSRSEQFCKWALLGLLVFSVLCPIWCIINYDLLYATESIIAMLAIVLIATAVEGIIGIVAWCMISRDNEDGKKVLFRFYASTFGMHGLIFLSLVLIPIFTDIVFFASEYYVSLALLGNSAAILLLQRYWTKYLF